jgi:hypothetical protein
MFDTLIRTLCRQVDKRPNFGGKKDAGGDALSRALENTVSSIGTDERGRGAKDARCTVEDGQTGTVRRELRSRETECIRLLCFRRSNGTRAS